MKCNWRIAFTAVFYTLTTINLLLTIERLVFDVFGMMWATMLLNIMTGLCTLTGMGGVCIKERIAMGIYLVWSLISVGVNIVVLLIYQEVGLLSEKEHYLGFTLGSDNWWGTHGIGCSHGNSSTWAGEMGGSGESAEGDGGGAEGCVLSYAVIETIHAGAYILLTVLSSIVVLVLIVPKKKVQGSDNESFSYVSVAQLRQFPKPHLHFSQQNQQNQQNQYNQQNQQSQHNQHSRHDQHDHQHQAKQWSPSSSSDATI